MVPIAYASSEGSEEPAHPQKICQRQRLNYPHRHRRNVDEDACRGCEFKISKALEMIGTSRNSLYLPHVCIDVLLCQPKVTVTKYFVYNC